MMFFKMKKLGFFSALLIFFWIVGVSHAELNASVLSEKARTPRGNISLTPMILESLVDSSYVLGPGDFLDLFLENNYFSVQVNPDGTIVIDECGAVEVGGKTFAEAKKAILEKISSHYDAKYSSVQISKLKGVKVSIIGALVAPGQISLESQTRLSTLIRHCGGFLPTADQENLKIFRGKDTLKIDLLAMNRLGNFEDDVILEQGDRVFVPFVESEKAVTLVVPGKSISLTYKEGRTVREYYQIAMGENIESGVFRSVKLKTSDGKERRLSVLEAAQEIPAVGTEILCINDSGTNEFVYVGGAVAHVGKVPYNPEFKALDYIAESGVSPITGSWEQVHVVRGNRETIYVNVTEDVILPGDYIEIPRSTYERFKDFTLFIASLLTVVSSSFIIYMNYK